MLCAMLAAMRRAQATHCRRLLLAVLLVAAACGDDLSDAPADGSPADLGVVDASADFGGRDGDTFDGSDNLDLAMADVGTDAGSDMDTPEDAARDAPPSMGFGTLAGPCFLLDTELTDAEPSLFMTHLDFAMDAFDDPVERPLLTDGAQQILEDPNAGGSSKLSEAFAFEVLARCEGAALLKTETEIAYQTPGTITDLLVEIDGLKIGVSVVRAFVFPPSSPYTVEEATTKIGDKLEGILASSANVAPEDAWTKQILAVIAYGDMHAQSVRAAWEETLDAETRANTIVYVVVTDGDDQPLY